jgi:hypothetical protein
LRAVFGGGKTFSHSLDPFRTSATGTASDEFEKIEVADVALDAGLSDMQTNSVGKRLQSTPGCVQIRADVR